VVEAPNTREFLTEDARALLRDAGEIHDGRHGTRTFTSGTHVPLEAAGWHIGIRPSRQRYHDAIVDLEYEGAIEWDTSARYARGTSTTSSPGAAWTMPGRVMGNPIMCSSHQGKPEDTERRR
jgi:hypothetical protein